MSSGSGVFAGSLGSSAGSLASSPTPVAQSASFTSPVDTDKVVHEDATEASTNLESLLQELAGNGPSNTRKLALLSRLQELPWGADLGVGEAEKALVTLETLRGGNTSAADPLSAAVKGSAVAVQAAIFIVLDLPHKRKNHFQNFVHSLLSVLGQTNNDSNIPLRTAAAMALYEIELTYPGMLSSSAAQITRYACHEKTPALGAYATLASAVVPSGVKMAGGAQAKRASRRWTRNLADSSAEFVMPPSYLSHPLQFKIPRETEKLEAPSELSAMAMDLASLLPRLPPFAQLAIITALITCSRPLGLDRNVVVKGISCLCHGLITGGCQGASDIRAIAVVVALRGPLGWAELLSDGGCMLLSQIGLLDPAMPPWRVWLACRWRKDLLYYLVSRGISIPSPIRPYPLVVACSPIVLSELLCAVPAALASIDGGLQGGETQARCLTAVTAALRKYIIKTEAMTDVYTTMWVSWLLADDMCGGKTQTLTLLVNVLLSHPQDLGKVAVRILVTLKNLAEASKLNSCGLRRKPSLTSLAATTVEGASRESVGRDHSAASSLIEIPRHYSLSYRSTLRAAKMHPRPTRACSAVEHSVMTTPRASGASEATTAGAANVINDAVTIFEWLHRNLPLALLHTATQRGLPLGPLLHLVEYALQLPNPDKAVIEALAAWLRARGTAAEWNEELLSLSAARAAFRDAPASPELLDALQVLIASLHKPDIRAQATMLHSELTRTEPTWFNSLTASPAAFQEAASELVPRCMINHTMELRTSPCATTPSHQGGEECQKCAGILNLRQFYRCDVCDFNLCIACAKVQCRLPATDPKRQAEAAEVFGKLLTVKRVAGTRLISVASEGALTSPEAYTSATAADLTATLGLTFEVELVDTGEGLEIFAVEVHMEPHCRDEEAPQGCQRVLAGVLGDLPVMVVPFVSQGLKGKHSLEMRLAPSFPAPFALHPTVTFTVHYAGSWMLLHVPTMALPLKACDLMFPCPAPRDAWLSIFNTLWDSSPETLQDE
eukprot:Sspe_Gene.14577::Locus_5042_Transcript_1_1_Confidence_1.000_Length_3072::g.14577::m.14577